LKMARLQFIIHHSAFIISSLRYSVFIHRIVATPRASIVRCRPISSRARFYQAVEQRTRFVEVAHLQGGQPTLFQKLGARYLDAGLVVRARRGRRTRRRARVPAARGRGSREHRLASARAPVNDRGVAPFEALEERRERLLATLKFSLRGKGFTPTGEGDRRRLSS